MILGHAHPAVVEAVRAAAAAAASRFGTPTENEVALAEEIVARVAPGRAGPPGHSRHRGDDERRSGWRAASPGAPVVVKFAGCYHGHVDALLAVRRLRRRHLRAARHPWRHRRRPRPTPSSLPYNDVAAVEAAFAEHGDRDRLRHHRGRRGEHGRRPAGSPVSPKRCAAITHRARRPADQRRGHDRLPRLAGRAGSGSRASAPDLFTFGKVMGGGFPAAAFGGRADVMAALAPDGPGLPGRHAVREPGRDRGRAGDPARRARRRGLPRLDAAAAPSGRRRAPRP